MATKADLRRMMLAHLKVIDATETPSSEHASMADLWIDAARGMLLEDSLCWWDEDAIPAAVTIPFAYYVAGLSCAAFGKNGKGYEAGVAPARTRIAALKSSDQRDTVRGEYS